MKSDPKVKSQLSALFGAEASDSTGRGLDSPSCQKCKEVNRKNEWDIMEDRWKRRFRPTGPTSGVGNLLPESEGSAPATGELRSSSNVIKSDPKVKGQLSALFGAEASGSNGRGLDPPSCQKCKDVDRKNEWAIMKDRRKRRFRPTVPRRELAQLPPGIGGLRPRHREGSIALSHHESKPKVQKTNPPFFSGLKPPAPKKGDSILHPAQSAKRSTGKTNGTIMEDRWKQRFRPTVPNRELAQLPSGIGGLRSRHRGASVILKRHKVRPKGQRPTLRPFRG